MNSWVNKRYNSIIFLVVFFPLLFTGCALFKKEAPKVRETGLVRIASSDYPEFSDDMDYDGLEHGILKSMLYLNKIPADRKFRFGEDVFDAAHMIRSMELFVLTAWFTDLWVAATRDRFFLQDITNLL